MTDSHIGGPVLWPRDEPWPYCDGATHTTLGYDAGDTRGVRNAYTAPVQLYRRDFPELPFRTAPTCSSSCWPDVRLVRRASAAVTDVLADPPEPAAFEPMRRASKDFSDGALNVWVCTDDVRHPLKVNTD